MSIGLESAHSFGDILFNLPLIKAIKEKYQKPVHVAVRNQYKDGLYNIPFIDKIITIKEMNQGVREFNIMGYEQVYQITQNVKFFEFKEKDPNHSLIDTPLYTGRQIGLPDFNQKPIYNPTEQELEKTEIDTSLPIIAIEHEAKSGQSWAKLHNINEIVQKFKNTHRILWLSNKESPDLPCVDNLLRFSRREVIACLRHAELFFSVGSGFFCASMALQNEMQPKKIYCLWLDGLYKYKDRLNELQLHQDINWINDECHLKSTLEELPLY